MNFSGYYPYNPRAELGSQGGGVAQFDERAPQAGRAGPAGPVGQRGEVGLRGSASTPAPPTPAVGPVKRVRQEFPESWIWTETNSRYLENSKIKSEISAFYCLYFCFPQLTFSKNGSFIICGLWSP